MVLFLVNDDNPDAFCTQKWKELLKMQGQLFFYQVCTKY